MQLTSKLLAIDPSLRSSGWALFDLKSGNLNACGIVSPPGTSVLLAHRLSILQSDVTALFETLELAAGDILVCEGPAPLVVNPQSSLKVEHVRGIFEAVARSKGLVVPGRLNPRTVQTELLGLKGKQLTRKEVKLAAKTVAQRLFADEFSTMLSKKATISQDIIDACLIGALSISKIQICLKLGTEIHTAFAEGNRSLKGGRRQATRWNIKDLPGEYR